MVKRHLTTFPAAIARVSDLAEEQQNRQSDHDQTEKAAGIITPSPAVRPGR